VKQPAPAPRALDRVGLGLCVVSAAGFGSLAIFGKQAYAGGLGVVGVLALRFAVAAPLLVGLALLARRGLRLGRPTALRLLALGGIGYAIQATLFFNALTRISAGLAALLLYLYPALVTAGAVALGRSRLDRATVLGLALSLAGIVLVLGLPGERLDALGVALGLASAGWYTLYILVGEYLLRGVDPLAASAYVSSGAACSFLAAAVVVGGRGLAGATPAAYAAAVAMAVVGTALAIATFLAGMARVGSAWASIASSFEPVFTVALGAAVLGDRLGPGKVVGGLAVVAGAVLLPLLGGARETVGSRVRGAGTGVDGASGPVVSSKPKNAATRGSTRR
jgi:drug/metabolite transporter (DMT)-like permease